MPSTFEVPVVPITLEPHPNADSLSIVKVFGYPVVARTEDWLGKDRAAYVPVDAVVPANDPRWEFLQGHNRIKAKRLRGIYSQGLLTPAPEGAQLGDNVADLLGIVKYEEPDKFSLNTDAGPPPYAGVVQYTGIEHLRRYKHLFKDGEPVVATAKIHGANARFTHVGDQLFVGSHHTWKREDSNSPWWKVLDEGSRQFIMDAPDKVVMFGEVFGDIQDLKYNHKPGKFSLRFFDIFFTPDGRYIDWVEFEAVTKIAEVLYGIKTVPVVYRGPFDYDKLVSLAEQDDPISGGIMEGLVVRPTQERYEDEVGRLILKLHSERYLLRKGA